MLGQGDRTVISPRHISIMLLPWYIYDLDYLDLINYFIYNRVLYNNADRL